MTDTPSQAPSRPDPDRSSDKALALIAPREHATGVGGDDAPKASAPDRPKLSPIWREKLANRLRLLRTAAHHAWPGAAAIACAGALGWAAGALHASDPGTARAARAAELDARLAQMAGELRAVRELTSASARAAARPAEEMKPVADRLAASLERAEKRERDAAARLAQIGDKIDSLQRASTQQAATAAPRPAIDAAPTATIPKSAAQPLPKPDSKALAEAAAKEGPKEGPKRHPGWRLREVTDGLAIIEHGSGEMIDIAEGERLPGGGRVRRIEKRGGKWIVLTDKGFID